MEITLLTVLGASPFFTAPPVNNKSLENCWTSRREYLRSKLYRIWDSDTVLTYWRILNNLILSILPAVDVAILMRHSRRRLWTIRIERQRLWQPQVCVPHLHRFFQIHSHIWSFRRFFPLSIVLPSVRLFVDVCFCLALAWDITPLLFYWQDEDTKVFRGHCLRKYTKSPLWTSWQQAR